MYDIEVSADPAPLFADSATWDALSEGIPFRETAWLQSWWQTFGVGHDAYVVTARRRDGTLVAILPLYRVESKGAVTIASMGDGTVCTDHTSLLVHPHEDGIAVGEAMGRWLAEAASSDRNGWDFLRMDGVLAGNLPMTALSRGLRGAGAGLHACSRMHLWALPLEGRTWEQYLANLGANARRNARQRARLLEQNPDLELVVSDNAEAMAKDLETLIDLHQRRWNAEQEPGSFALEKARQFIRRVSKALFEQEQLRLPLLLHRGQPVAAELQFIGRNRVLYCYASGRDPAFDELGPGRIMHADALKYACSHQLAGVDMMRGDEPYKERFKCHPHPVLQLRAVAPRLLPRLQHAAWRTGFEVKQWMRRRIGRVPLSTFDMTAPVRSVVTAE